MRRKHGKVMSPSELTAWRKRHIIKIQESGWNTIRKRVICLDTGEIYYSASEAAKEVGVSAQVIRNACNPNQKSTPTAAGKRWRYYTK